MSATLTSTPGSSTTTPAATLDIAAPAVVPAVPPTRLPDLPGTEPPAPPITEASTLPPGLQNLPDIAKMEADLGKSGILLPELQMSAQANQPLPDNSPLAALQPAKLKNSSDAYTTPAQPVANVPRLNPIQLATPTAGIFTASLLPEGISFPWQLIVGGLLFISALWGILQVAVFARTQYPALYQLVATNAMPISELNTAMGKAALVGGLATVNLCFILVVAFVGQTKQKLLLFIAAVILVVAGTIVQQRIAPPQLTSGSPLDLWHVLTTPVPSVPTTSSYNELF